LLIANPLQVVKKIVSGVIGSLKGSHLTKAFYLETLKMCYELLNKARKDGLLAIESISRNRTRARCFPNIPNFSRITTRGTLSATRSAWR